MNPAESNSGSGGGRAGGRGHFVHHHHQAQPGHPMTVPAALEGRVRWRRHMLSLMVEAQSLLGPAQSVREEAQV